MREIRAVCLGLIEELVRGTLEIWHVYLKFSSANVRCLNQCNNLTIANLPGHYFEAFFFSQTSREIHQ